MGVNLPDSSRQVAHPWLATMVGQALTQRDYTITLPNGLVRMPVPSS